MYPAGACGLADSGSVILIYGSGSVRNIYGFGTLVFAAPVKICNE
jgi:hypothetical protein